MKYINNPANIRFSPRNNWQGQIKSKNGFCQFDSLKHGVRALFKILLHYINDLQLTDVRSIISRFAPASENDTEKYVSYILQHLLDPCTTEDGIIELAQLICWYESNTFVPYGDMKSLYFLIKLKSI